MDDVTDTLRDVLHRAAEPGDPTGVADAIRSRVASGDAGVSAAGSGPFPTGRRWLRWIGAGVILMVLVVGIGLSALLGSPEPAGKPPVDRPTGAVLAPEQSEAPTPTPTAESPTPTDEPVETVGPARESNPAPEPSTAAPEPVDRPPTLDRVIARPANPFCGQGSSTILASASDDHGVTAVTISWSGADSGSATMKPSGNAWTYVYRPSGRVRGKVAFSARAIDTAEQTSAPKTVVVNVDCLI